MNNFNFSEEMVLGKKHLDTLVYEKNKYNLYQFVENLFNTSLDELHKSTNTIYPPLTKDMLGKDSNTEFHKLFYNKLNNGWPELIGKYNEFIKDVISPYLGLSEFLYQKFPTFRIHLPNNTAICIEHHDSDEKHNHPIGEINFLVIFNTGSVGKVKTSQKPLLRFTCGYHVSTILIKKAKVKPESDKPSNR